MSLDLPTTRLLHVLQHPEVQAAVEVHPVVGGGERGVLVRSRYFFVDAAVRALEPAPPDVDGGVQLTARFPTDGGGGNGRGGPSATFALSPQRGVVGALSSLGEQKLGEPDLDDAWVVRCDDAGFSLLKRLKPFLRLYGVPQSGDRLLLTADRFEARGSDVARAPALVLLWEALARDRVSGAH